MILGNLKVHHSGMNESRAHLGQEVKWILLVLHSNQLKGSDKDRGSLNSREVVANGLLGSSEITRHECFTNSAMQKLMFKWGDKSKALGGSQKSTQEFSIRQAGFTKIMRTPIAGKCSASVFGLDDVLTTTRPLSG